MLVWNLLISKNIQKKFFLPIIAVHSNGILTDYLENKKEYAVEQFYMRMYFPSKMNQLLIGNGLRILHQWGDYYHTELGEASKLQIYDTCLA